MDYEKSIPFDGDAKKALEVSLNLFVQQGFKVLENSDSGHELTGPGMISSRQNPLTGISGVRVNAGDGELSIRAEFSAIRKMTLLLVVFLCSLALFFFLFFGVMFRGESDYNVFLPLAPFLPWPFLIPVLLTVFKRRTARALDTLLHNMSTLAKSS
jgi:hypothetical protein